MKKAITAAQAKSISTPGSHYAGETLYLHVAPRRLEILGPASHHTWAAL